MFVKHVTITKYQLINSVRSWTQKITHIINNKSIFIGHSDQISITEYIF